MALSHLSIIKAYFLREKCFHVSSLEKTSAVIGAAIALDVLTEILGKYSNLLAKRWILTTRIYQHSNSQPLASGNASRQKLGIGAFPCLSVCTIFIAGIRISGFRPQGEIGISWQYFWWQVEASTAVVAVSATAFRSFFTDRSTMEGEKGKLWYSSAVERNLRRREMRRRFDLVHIPGDEETGPERAFGEAYIPRQDRGR